MNKWILKRRILQIKMVLSKVGGTGSQRAQILKKSELFHYFREGCQWHPIAVPSEPWLMEIGNNVTIAAGVLFFTHDVSHAALNAYYIEEPVVPLLGTIRIGNNVMIGANSVILPNVEIGDNVIVGAGSIVTKDLKSNGVYAGNPAKFICTFDALHKKRSEEKIDLTKSYNAVEQVNYYWR